MFNANDVPVNEFSEEIIMAPKGRGRRMRFASKPSMSKKKSSNKYNQESYVRQEKQPSQPLTAPIPDVPEPEPKQTIALWNRFV
ncbi:12997_t:CDS:2 [Rhizophagus irregularis]|nr:12997_t:CDS:2 [Rhizophagus irregularis]